MNTNPGLVNYEKYFLSLKFVFSDIPKLPYQSKGPVLAVSGKSAIPAKDLYPTAVAVLSTPQCCFFEDSLQDPFIPSQKQAFFASRFYPLPLSPQRLSTGCKQLLKKNTERMINSQNCQGFQEVCSYRSFQLCFYGQEFHSFSEQIWSS